MKPKRKHYSFTAKMPALPDKVAEADDQMKSGADFARLCSDLQNCAQESFHVITLTHKHCVIDRHMVSLGTLTGAPVHPREVYRAALLDCAAAVAFVHNHPSGDTVPSRDDREITARLIEAGRILGIRVLDHVIVGRPKGDGDKGYFSFVDGGLL